MAALVGRACGLGSFVRMPVTSYATVTQALESGVDGVMAAQVTSAAESREIRHAGPNSPRAASRRQHARGRCRLHATSRRPNSPAPANRDHFTAIQIETLGALEDVDAIAAIDGVDLLFVGPADLSQALGVLGQPDHEKVWTSDRSRGRRVPQEIGKGLGHRAGQPGIRRPLRRERLPHDHLRQRRLGDAAGRASLKTMFASQFGGELK